MSVEIRCQNLDRGDVPSCYVIENEQVSVPAQRTMKKFYDGSVPVRTESYSYGRILITGQWIDEDKGTFQTPDGKQYYQRGRAGDEWEEPWLRLTLIS